MDDARQFEAIEVYVSGVAKDEELKEDAEGIKETLRTVTPTAIVLMHRQIESMQIGELERRNLNMKDDLCEDSDEEKTLEKTIQESSRRIEGLHQEARQAPNCGQAR